MRIVEANIAALGLKIGDTVTVQLLDILGEKIAFVEDGKLITYDETITIDHETLTLSLWENDNSKRTTYYALKINNIAYNFTVPSGIIPHDLLSLFTLGCNDGVSYLLRGYIFFENDFIQKIKKYFDNEEPNFTKTQESAFDQLIVFADTCHGTTKTIDHAAALDKYLGGL